LKQIISKYSLNPKVEYTFFNKKKKEKTGVLASFPSKEFFNNKKKLFNTNSFLSLNLSSILFIQRISANIITTLVNRICGVKICKNLAQEIYYIRDLGRKFIGGSINMLNSHKIQR
jgi:hypothetical protein